jgi:nucleotide-binding universal stress UspA family protein
MDVHRILVGLDGSPREPLVLAAAQDLALRFNASLRLVRAVGLPPEIPAEAWLAPQRSLKEYLEGVAHAGLERCARTLCEALRSSCQLEVVVATPWEALCLCAQAHEADMIVIGSHGYGGLDRILGTTAARVVNHALCSVFVVRASENPSHRAHAQGRRDVDIRA